VSFDVLLFVYCGVFIDGVVIKLLIPALANGLPRKQPCVDYKVIRYHSIVYFLFDTMVIVVCHVVFVSLVSGLCP